MFHVSNHFLGLLNLIFLLSSIPIIFLSNVMGGHLESECARFLKFPMFVLGISLLVISLMGLIGSCCQVSFFLWIYATVTFLLMIAIFCFSIFAFVVTNKGVGEAIAGTGFKEYYLDDYSNWLQKQVQNEEYWRKIKSCLNDAAVCSSLGPSAHGDDDAYTEAAEFYKRHLTPIQSGCCKPPMNCGYAFENATVWTVPQYGVDTYEADCRTWSNEQEKLCYDCGSCKAGVLATLKMNWRKLSIINMCFLVFLNILYSIACCALRNNKLDSHPRYRPYYY